MIVLAVFLVGIVFPAGASGAYCNPKTANLDIILMIDPSENVGEENFRKLKNYLGSIFLPHFTISTSKPMATRFGICNQLTFRLDPGPVGHINLAQSRDLLTLQTAINTFPYNPLNKSFSIPTNSFWANGLFTYGNRPDSADVIMVFSATKIEGYDPVYPFFEHRARGGKVIAVALGTAVTTADLAPLSPQTFGAPDYDRLHASLTEPLLRALCDDRCYAHLLEDGDVTRPAGALYSPLFPRAYCNDLLYVHTLLMVPPLTVELNISLFDTAPGDQLAIYRGANLAERANVYSGHHDSIYQRGPGNSLGLVFSTNQSGNSIGYYGRFRACMPGLFTVCPPPYTDKDRQPSNGQEIGASARQIRQRLESSKQVLYLAEQRHAEGERSSDVYCGNNKSNFDLVLMLDNSKSITESGFRKMIDFLADSFLPEFQISQSRTRVGISGWFGQQRLNTSFLDLNGADSLADVQNALRALPYPLEDDFNHVQLNSFWSWGMFTGGANRAEIADVILVVSSNRLTGYNPHYPFVDFAQSGGRVITLAVGPGATADDLMPLASSPRHAFGIANRDDFASIKTPLLNAFCDDRCYPNLAVTQRRPSGAGDFATARYPQDYCNNLLQFWLVETAPPLVIRLSIAEFLSELNRDFLQFHRGYLLGEPLPQKIVGPISGNQSNLRFDSTSSLLLATFRTSARQPAAGFKAQYTSCMFGLFQVCVSSNSATTAAASTTTQPHTTTTTADQTTTTTQPHTTTTTTADQTTATTQPHTTTTTADQTTTTTQPHTTTTTTADQTTTTTQPTNSSRGVNDHAFLIFVFVSCLCFLLLARHLAI